MIILINSSKTMGQVSTNQAIRTPALIKQATQLAKKLQVLSIQEIAAIMHISLPLAEKTKRLMQLWVASERTTAALDAFQGDIFKGLRAHTFLEADRLYADEHLHILSGLYGILRPLDAVKPYRLELMYKLQIDNYDTLYDFWKDAPAKQLPLKTPIVQLASQEYFRLLEPYINADLVVTPQFMTQLPGDSQPQFVTVHAKVTRGAFARWMILNRVETSQQLMQFNDLGYRYDPTLSSTKKPVFITHTAVKPTQLV